jgi:hypothetical protein
MIFLGGCFRERIDAIGDPLLLGVVIVRNDDVYFVLRKCGEQWYFGSGKIFELAMCQHKIRVLLDSGWLTVPAENDPLWHVTTLLSDVSIAGWRAYDWTSSELGYLLHRLPDEIGAAPLLHLIAPVENPSAPLLNPCCGIQWRSFCHRDGTRFLASPQVDERK